MSTDDLQPPARLPGRGNDLGILDAALFSGLEQGCRPAVGPGYVADRTRRKIAPKGQGASVGTLARVWAIPPPESGLSALLATGSSDEHGW